MQPLVLITDFPSFRLLVPIKNPNFKFTNFRKDEIFEFTKNYYTAQFVTHTGHRTQFLFLSHYDLRIKYGHFRLSATHLCARRRQTWCMFRVYFEMLFQCDLLDKSFSAYVARMWLFTETRLHYTRRYKQTFSAHLLTRMSHFVMFQRFLFTERLGACGTNVRFVATVNDSKMSFCIAWN